MVNTNNMELVLKDEEVQNMYVRLQGEKIKDCNLIIDARGLIEEDAELIIRDSKIINSKIIVKANNPIKIILANVELSNVSIKGNESSTYGLSIEGYNLKIKHFYLNEMVLKEIEIMNSLVDNLDILDTDLKTISIDNTQVGELCINASNINNIDINSANIGYLDILYSKIGGKITNYSSIKKEFIMDTNIGRNYVYTTTIINKTINNSKILEDRIEKSLISNLELTDGLESYSEITSTEGLTIIDSGIKVKGIKLYKNLSVSGLDIGYIYESNMYMIGSEKYTPIEFHKRLKYLYELGSITEEDYIEVITISNILK